MRYHPFTILFRIVQLVKNSFVIALVLFVFRRDSQFWLFEYGRYLFLLYIAMRIVHIVVSWFFETYEWKENRYLILNKGILVRKTSTVPLHKIQNVTQKTTLFHKVVGCTSLVLETSMDGEDDEIKFDVISTEQARLITQLVQQAEQVAVEQAPLSDQEQDGEHMVLQEKTERAAEKERVVHFKPTKRSLWKASFTSLSFLAIIPVAASLYDNLSPFLSDWRFENILPMLSETWGIVLVATVAIPVALVFGVIRTFIRYGNYEISSTDTHIYIKRGFLEESSFAIDKRKVQGIEIKQTVLKRLFGLAEVKLVSSVRSASRENAVSVNSLYPFLPQQEAIQLVQALLPQYFFEWEMNRLPKKSLWIKLLRPSWLWLVVTAGLVYFQPTFFHLDQAWWLLSLVLLVIVVLNRILDYVNTRYGVVGDQVQWWRGGLTSRLFITKRKNIVEVEYNQSPLQKGFRLISVKTKHRSNPLSIEGVDDVPVQFATAFDKWYQQRERRCEGDGACPK